MHSPAEIRVRLRRCEAFKKGYKQAEETWGGKLPDISQRTYDAVMEKFDKMAQEAGMTVTN